MPNQAIELDEIWEKLADERSITGENLIEIFESKGQDAESAYAFYDEWRGRGVLHVPFMQDQTVKGTRVPRVIRRTDEVGVKHLRSLGYTLK